MDRDVREPLGSIQPLGAVSEAKTPPPPLRRRVERAAFVCGLRWFPTVGRGRSVGMDMDIDMFGTQFG